MSASLLMLPACEVDVMANQKRSQKRSRSGATETCPHCEKKLRGAKGLRMHLEVEHGDYNGTIFPRPSKEGKYKKVGVA